jgi:hypothetical protein
MDGHVRPTFKDGFLMVCMKYWILKRIHYKTDKEPYLFHRSFYKQSRDFESEVRRTLSAPLPKFSLGGEGQMVFLFLQKQNPVRGM